MGKSPLRKPQNDTFVEYKVKIYTKTGDKGETSLLGGTRVSKAHAKIEAYGTVDELNATIGLLAVHAEAHQATLSAIQHILFEIGSLLAKDDKTQFPLQEVEDVDVQLLENEIDRMNESLPELRNFILPGGNMGSATAQLARTICRRAERRVVVLEQENDKIVQYLNRLSDYLFVLGRMLLLEKGDQEIKWEPRS